MAFVTFCRLGHAYLSIFFLPVAALYAVTGVCYVCGYSGTLDSARYTVALDALPPVTAETKGTLLKKILSDNGIPCPAGEGSESRKGFMLGLPTGQHAVLEPLRENAKEALITVNTPDLFYKLVLLHKAKGGTLFNILGVAFGVALLLMYLSGILLFLKASEFRNKLAICFAGGLIITTLVIVVSI